MTVSWWWIILVVVPVAVLFVWALVDLARHDGMPTGHKLLWLAAIVLLPLLGALAYLVARPPRQADIRGFGRRRPRQGRAAELLGEDDDPPAAGEKSTEPEEP